MDKFFKLSNRLADGESPKPPLFFILGKAFITVGVFDHSDFKVQAIKFPRNFFVVFDLANEPLKQGKIKTLHFYFYASVFE